MSVPRSLYPKPGDDVELFWRRLLRWAESTDVIVGSPGLTMNVTPIGTAVYYRPRTSWDHPWRVSASAVEAQIGPGMVEGEIPWIGEVRLDGTDRNGRETDVPILPIEPPPSGNLSWIVVVRRVDPAAKASLSSVENPDFLRLDHKPAADLEFPAGRGRRIDRHNQAFQELARIDWDDDGQIRAVRQVAYHNMGFWFDGERYQFFANG